MTQSDKLIILAFLESLEKQGFEIVKKDERNATKNQSKTTEHVERYARQT